MATKLNDNGVQFADGTVLDASTTAGATSLKVGGVTKATIGATGVIETLAGIKFPATQVASSDVNTLDDYEEGTWTPVLSGTGLTTYTSSGKYTKIGSLVLASFTFTITAASGGAGTLTISGLPFSCGAIGAGCGSREVGVSGVGINANLAPSASSLTCVLDNNATPIATNSAANMTIVYYPA